MTHSLPYLVFSINKKHHSWILINNSLWLGCTKTQWYHWRKQHVTESVIMKEGSPTCIILIAVFINYKKTARKVVVFCVCKLLDYWTCIHHIAMFVSTIQRLLYCIILVGNKSMTLNVFYIECLHTWCCMWLYVSNQYLLHLHRIACQVLDQDPFHNPADNHSWIWSQKYTWIQIISKQTSVIMGPSWGGNEKRNLILELKSLSRHDYNKLTR